MDADLELEVDEAPEAGLVDGAVVGERSGKDRKNALKIPDARSVGCGL